MNKPEANPGEAVQAAAKRLADAQDHLETAAALGDPVAWGVAINVCVVAARVYLKRLEELQEADQG